jgi:GT2 family glycosyltransferase
MRSGGAPLTVLIVNYKAYDALAACLDELAKDPDGARAAVVVVDHQTDEKQLAKAIQRHPRAVAIPRRENRGFAAGINEAAARANSELLLLLNPDTRVTPRAIEHLASYLASNPDVVAVGPKVVSPDGSLQATGRQFPGALTGLFGRTTLLTRLWPGNPISRQNLVSAEAAAPVDVDWVAGTCVMIRTQAFREVGGFDERFFLYWEDADLCQRLRAQGGRVVFVPSAVVEHAAAQSSDRARVRSLVAFHRSALRYYGKYYRGPGRMIALPFAAVALTARLCVKVTAALWRR